MCVCSEGQEPQSAARLPVVTVSDTHSTASGGSLRRFVSLFPDGVAALFEDTSGSQC